MKLKDVCQQTGLSQKTVRFYEEKQLISPTSIIKNGRSYRDYSEADVKALQEIAVLRKALFTIEEIYLMQQEPEEIENIVLNYAQRIVTMASTLNSLAETVTTLNISSLTDISELAQAMDSSARALSLPSYDLNPKFRYIDALELAEIEHNKMEKQRKQGESPFFLEQQQFTQRKGLFSEHYNHNTALTGGSANFPKPQEPKVLRVVNILISTLILICTLAILYFVQQRKLRLVLLWTQIKGWMIPLDLAMILIRLLTKRIYGFFLKKSKP